MATFNNKTFQNQLLAWFSQHGRKNLPWQLHHNPYHILLSEVMLQQTQVKTVIPYFERFIQTFPTIKSLANANLEQVLHCWSGLGYYNRARNLHKTANIIVEKFAEKIPNKMYALLTLPGIGQSTAGAILASAFNQKATILDGNVKRVLTRFYGIMKPINQKETENLLWSQAEKLTPRKNIANYTQAMMDLGALICTRSKPSCHHCPLQKACKAYENNLTSIIPTKITKKPLPIKKIVFLIMKFQNNVFLQKRNEKGVWHALWSFPESSLENMTAIKKFAVNKYRLIINETKILPSFRHTFTHYHLDILPILFILKEKNVFSSEDHLWYSMDNPPTIGLPQPIKKIMLTL